MKRLFYLILLFFLLLFCGCAQSAPEPLCWQSYPLSLDLTLQKEDFTLQGTLQMQKAGAGTLTVTAPETLKGIVFSFDGGQAQIQKNGLTLPLDPARLPAGSALFRALSLEDPAAFLKSRNEDGWIFTLVGEEENLLFYTDEQGTLLKIQMEGEEPWSAVFKKN
ncbi:MAG: hypothetical protein IJZ37_00500 [Clostridia bacterium]|nr:hypothetical protein [Clostridia bacterium]MBQ8399667.1 hypothetical protein [Clostridia bacterium]